MKRLFAICIVLLCLAGVGDEIDPALVKALQRGAKAKLFLKVIDESGAPVPEAKVEFCFWNTHMFGGYKTLSLTTDANGLCVAEGVCNGTCNWTANKDGYYKSKAQWSLARTSSDVKVQDGKWQPYGGNREIRLKRIKKTGTCSIFPETLRNKKVPAYGQWLGLDLEKGDWVEPFGAGSETDILLRLTAEMRTMQDFRFVIEASFTNNAFAGAYVLTNDFSSELWTSHCADVQAQYKPSLVFELKSSPSGELTDTCLKSDSHLVFRTRTVVDESGKLVSAHYGKILGQWVVGEKTMTISDGCFNPVPNDTNIEDSMTLRNVFRGRQVEEMLKKRKHGKR